MDNPTYKFEVFDGPLDLLLNLIEKHKINIYDIQISLLLDQYMMYINQYKMQNWDLTADFIEMTARLMYIKSYALLPPKETPNEEDPKQELERLLQEYAKYKQLSGELRDTYIGAQIYFREVLPEGLPKTSSMYSYESEKLKNAYRRLLIKYSDTPPQDGTFKKIISSDYVSVASRISYIENKFIKHPQIYFEDMFEECKSKSEVIATFLAILELLRMGRLVIKDKDDRIMMSAAEEEQE